MATSPALVPKDLIVPERFDSHHMVDFNTEEVGMVWGVL
jgi:hypothetical protein